jgi:hypothetical protein
MNRTVLELGYRRSLTQFTDTIGGGIDRHRQKLALIPTIVYKDATTVRGEKNVHLIWLSSPDPDQYGIWVFSQCILVVRHTDMLADPVAQPLFAAIAAITSDTQPQAFEKTLQALGFRHVSML